MMYSKVTKVQKEKWVTTNKNTDKQNTWRYNNIKCLKLLGTFCKLSHKVWIINAVSDNDPWTQQKVQTIMLCQLIILGHSKNFSSATHTGWTMLEILSVLDPSSTRILRNWSLRSEKSRHVFDLSIKFLKMFVFYWYQNNQSDHNILLLMLIILLSYPHQHQKKVSSQCEVNLYIVCNLNMIDWLVGLDSLLFCFCTPWAMKIKT